MEAVVNVQSIGLAIKNQEFANNAEILYAKDANHKINVLNA